MIDQNQMKGMLRQDPRSFFRRARGNRRPAFGFQKIRYQFRHILIVLHDQDLDAFVQQTYVLPSDIIGIEPYYAKPWFFNCLSHL